MSKVWIVVADDMAASSVSAVAVSAGAEVEAIVLGHEERANYVATLGAAKVSWYDTGEVLAEVFAPAIAQKAALDQPKIVVAADEATARVITGAIAAKIGALSVSAVKAISLDEDRIILERACAEGASVEVLSTSVPVTCLIGDGGEDAQPCPPASIEKVEAPFAQNQEVVAYHEPEGSGVNLAEAQRVISCGIGIGTKENLALMDDLAAVLNAEVACSLPLCDNYHWFDHGRVVGSSTQKISPRFYLACGVSGAPNHMMGVRGAKVIMAINNDPEASIFREAKYGIVGDVKEVLPALTAALKNR